MKKKKISGILLKVPRKVLKKASKKVVPLKKKVIKMKITINKKVLQEETKMTMTILKLNFMLNVAKIKKLSITDLFLFLVTWIR